MSKKYQYEVKIYETVCYTAFVTARDEEELMEAINELDRSDKEMEWWDIDEFEIVDKELIGQW